VLKIILHRPFGKSHHKRTFYRQKN